MSTRTLGLWAAKWQIDPEDDNRADWRAAEIAAAVVNCAGAKKDDGTRFVPEDFTPYVQAQTDPEERRRREIERDEARLMAFFDRKAQAGEK